MQIKECWSNDEATNIVTNTLKNQKGKNVKKNHQFFRKFKAFQMKVTNLWRNYEASRGVINALMDKK